MQGFFIDKQTYQDLNIFGNGNGGASICSIFDHTQTLKGKVYLKDFMYSPVADHGTLTKRRDAFEFLSNLKNGYEFKALQLDFIEHYYSQNSYLLKSNFIDSFADHIKAKFIDSQRYYVISKGVKEIALLLIGFNDFLIGLHGIAVPLFIEELFAPARALFDNAKIRKSVLNLQVKRPGYLNVSRLDQLFRSELKAEILQVLDIIYQLDVYVSIAYCGKKHGFSFADYLDTEQPVLAIEELYNPLLQQPVKNDLHVDVNGNILLVTGANMAGKSTFLKSMGIAVYLAHLGLPVPAKSISLSVFNGLLTAINLADNIGSGESHYLREVMRLKEAALQVLERKKIVVLFDELFKGTNLADAMEASRETISALLKIKGSVFFVSTHMPELAAEFSGSGAVRLMRFRSYPAKEGITFDYLLQEGISEDRLGMYFFDRADIKGLLNKAAEG